MLSQNKQIIVEWFQSKADTVNSVYLLNENFRKISNYNYSAKKCKHLPTG